MDVNEDSLLMTHKIPQNLELDIYIIFLSIFFNLLLLVILYWTYGQIATRLKAFPSKAVF